jgi:hypothetical protein
MGRNSLLKGKVNLVLESSFLKFLMDLIEKIAAINQNFVI